MMPITFRSATPRMKTPAVTVAPTGTLPSRNAGRIAWSVAQPTAQAAATVIMPYRALPTTAAAKTRGSVRTATPRTFMPCQNIALSSTAAPRSAALPPSAAWSAPWPAGRSAAWPAVSSGTPPGSSPTLSGGLGTLSALNKHPSHDAPDPGRTTLPENAARSKTHSLLLGLTNPLS